MRPTKHMRANNPLNFLGVRSTFSKSTNRLLCSLSHSVSMTVGLFHAFSSLESKSEIVRDGVGGTSRRAGGAKDVVLYLEWL